MGMMSSAPTPEEKHFESIDSRCDAKAAYNFVLGTTVKIGHLLKLSFSNAGKDLEADTSVPNPMDPEAKVKVAGVFDFIAWQGGPTDPTNFTFRVSPKNKATLQEALSSLTGGSEVEIEYVIYDYDYTQKKYFKHFHTDEKKIKGVITKGTKITINNEPDRVIQQPLNFQVSGSLTAKSEGEEQEVSIAYTLSSPFTRRVGVTDA